MPRKKVWTPEMQEAAAELESEASKPLTAGQRDKRILGKVLVVCMRIPAFRMSVFSLSMCVGHFLYIFRSGDVEQALDLSFYTMWAILGLLLFDLLTGHRPFEVKP